MMPALESMDRVMARPRVRKDPKTGKWLVEYRDEKRRQHRLKGFKTKRDADARADQISGEVRKGIHVPDSTSCTVADACRVWLQRADDLGLETATIRSYRNHTDLHLKPLIDRGEQTKWEGPLGEIKLSRLTTQIAEAVGRELTRRLSIAMARKVLSSLKMILDEAQRQGLVVYNAAHPVKIKKRDRGENKVHAGIDFPTPPEMARVIAIITGIWRPRIVVDAFTGLRASELRGLEWKDVLALETDFPSVRVLQRADEKGKQGPTKSDTSHRSIPLTPLAAAELRAWRKVCPVDPETGELRLVFPNGAGRVENHSNLTNRGWQEWQIEAGLCRMGKNRKGETVKRALYGFHGLRHFFASLLIDQGFTPKRVQNLMGHSSIKLTLDTYTHLFPPEATDDRNRFADAEASVLTRTVTAGSPVGD
jgi:integrase